MSVCWVKLLNGLNPHQKQWRNIHRIKITCAFWYVLYSVYCYLYRCLLPLLVSSLLLLLLLHAYSLRSYCLLGVVGICFDGLILVFSLLLVLLSFLPLLISSCVKYHMVLFIAFKILRGKKVTFKNERKLYTCLIPVLLFML